MRVRSNVAVVAILLSVGIAGASPKTDIQAKIKEAMENYDLMDYEASRKGLTQALAIAKKNRLDRDPVVGRAHLSLGIVQFVNGDTDGAKLSFLSAVQIDPKIQIEAAYKSAEMSKLLEQVRKEAGSGGGAPAVVVAPAEAEPVAAAEPEPSGPDCSAVQGMQHEIVDTAKGGAPLRLEAFLGADVTASKVSIMYRAEGSTEFSEIKMSKDGCKYTGAIPPNALKGSLVHYYIGAYNNGPKAVASKGSSGSPNIIEISGAVASAGGGDDEDPISGGGGDGGSVSSNVTVGAKRARILFALAGGGGTGYVSGDTEGMNTVKNCCFGGPIVVLQPELGYFVNRQLSISLAGRIGLPIGANVEGHATAAPGGVARVRYALSATGEGVRVMGQLGAGILRNTIKLDDPADPLMDTDVVAQGPLLIGAGIGFTRRVSNAVSVMADLSALGAIAVVDSLGAAPVLNNGFGIDVSLGIQLGL